MNANDSRFLKKFQTHRFLAIIES